MSTWNYLKQKLRHILLLKVTSEWYDLALHFSRSNKTKKQKHKKKKWSGITACIRQVAWQPNKLNSVNLSMYWLMLGDHRDRYRVDYFLHHFTLPVLLEDLVEIYLLIFLKSHLCSGFPVKFKLMKLQWESYQEVDIVLDAECVSPLLIIILTIYHSLLVKYGNWSTNLRTLT